MKTCLIVVAFCAASCAAPTDFGADSALPTDAGATRFPIGTYTSCAQGLHNPDGNRFLNSAGFQPGAALTLAQSGTTVMATYVDQNGSTQSLSFSTTTGTTAALAQPGRVMAGFSGLCVTGPGSQKAYPASMNVTAGALSYSAGTVFVTLTGGLQSDGGTCGTLTAPEASFWLLCEDHHGGPLPSAEEPPPVTQLPIGEYSCKSQVETYKPMNGMNYYFAGGGSGTLTVARDGAKLRAQYEGDASLAGTLRLGIMTSTSAIVEAGQTLMSPCMVRIGTAVPSQTFEPLPIETGSLTMVDSTLFLVFAGTTADGASCPGAQVAGSVICSK